jgi:hypothetical protein
MFFRSRLEMEFYHLLVLKRALTTHVLKQSKVLSVERRNGRKREDREPKLPTNSSAWQQTNTHLGTANS